MCGEFSEDASTWVYKQLTRNSTNYTGRFLRAQDRQRPTAGPKGVHSLGDHFYDFARKSPGSAATGTKVPHGWGSGQDPSGPQCDPSRRKPDCLILPNGATWVKIISVLMPTMPLSSLSATRQIRFKPGYTRAIVDAIHARNSDWLSARRRQRPRIYTGL